MPAAPFHARLLRNPHRIGLVEVTGEVDMNTAQELGDVLAAALEGGPERVVVDLTAVGFIDSMGLSALVQNAKLAIAEGASFEIVADNRLMQVFDITGLRDVLTFHPTLADARV